MLFFVGPRIKPKHRFSGFSAASGSPEAEKGQGSAARFKD
jgi:hypothetical protein